VGKNAARRLRARGLVPGNVYGLDRPAFMVAVSRRRLGEILRRGTGVNTIFTLTLKGEERSREAMIKELQRDPVSDLPVHVDFVRVDPTRVVVVRVPVRLEGLPTGVKNEGGVLDFVHRDVEVECLPANIPEAVVVDVSELHINQHVSVKDLAAVEGVRVLADPDMILAVVSAPRLEEEAAPAAAEAEPAAEEPEVIRKGKEGAGPSEGQKEG
jgi:large subunit ribosomal protein L25